MDGNSGENQTTLGYGPADYFDDVKLVVAKTFEYLHRVEAIFSQSSMDQYATYLLGVQRNLALSVSLLINLQGSISIGREGRYSRDPNDTHSFKNYFHARDEDELPVVLKDAPTVSLAHSMVSQYCMLVEGTIQKIYQEGLSILHQTETFRLLRQSADLMRQLLDYDPVMRTIALVKCAPYYETDLSSPDDTTLGADLELAAFGMQLINVIKVGYPLGDVANMMALDSLSLRSRLLALGRHQPEVLKHIVTTLEANDEFNEQGRSAKEEIREFLDRSNISDFVVLVEVKNGHYATFGNRTGRPDSCTEVTLNELGELFQSNDLCKVLSLN